MAYCGSASLEMHTFVAAHTGSAASVAVAAAAASPRSSPIQIVPSPKAGAMNTGRTAVQKSSPDAWSLPAAASQYMRESEGCYVPHSGVTEADLREMRAKFKKFGLDKGQDDQAKRPDGAAAVGASKVTKAAALITPAGSPVLSAAAAGAIKPPARLPTGWAASVLPYKAETAAHAEVQAAAPVLSGSVPIILAHSSELPGNLEEDDSVHGRAPTPTPHHSFAENNCVPAAGAGMMGSLTGFEGHAVGESP